MHPLIEAIEKEISVVSRELKNSDCFARIQASFYFGKLDALKENLSKVKTALSRDGINNSLTDGIIQRNNSRKQSLMACWHNGFLSDYCRGEINGHSVILELIQSECVEKDYVEG